MSLGSSSTVTQLIQFIEGNLAVPFTDLDGSSNDFRHAHVISVSVASTIRGESRVVAHRFGWRSDMSGFRREPEVTG